ncbi:AAA family ATPase [Oscillibacter ruminantium]|uniref:AAA family ATPase n=1 Tax=Oscillibacter ruminantium TaxID=1263547 RepID=UPI0025AB1DDC|nr:AAA family ATPase [Oscillibacter valericigenes]
MKTTKIMIKNLFGIKEATLDGKSVEISGPKGSGKTSVLDSIRYALTNRSDRDYIIHQGADEGEIIIETDSGLTIDRKARTTKADSVKVRDGNMLQTRPAEFLNGIFTPLQLNPVEFTQLSRQEKNRVILSLIEFPWDTNWIREQFGEIPQGVDYSKHILEVLAQIQAENGTYFQSRQNLNRDIRNKMAFIADISKDIPDHYDFEKWNTYPTGEKYRELAKLKESNSVIERAKAFRSSYESKLRGIQGEHDMAVAAIDKDISRERENLTGTIERLRAEIKAAEDKLGGLEQRRDERVAVEDSKLEAARAKLEKDVGVADEYSGREPVDTTALQEEIDAAEAMQKHLNEYKRMVGMQDETDALQAEADELTRKIELARELPAQILAKATIPVAGLTVEDGIPLINGLPISNLSDGELLELCVDITVSKPGQLGIILVDGAERLDKDSRKRLYDKCKAKGLQLIATRVTDSEELEVTEL